ncbi:MAG: YcaO-like family protein [Candidatus Hydrothermae bacterium]|nr:YcaO-like family protein [Candidatus Hydrothermae bacterium]
MKNVDFTVPSLIDTVVGLNTGIVRNLYWGKVMPEDVVVYNYGAHMADTQVLWGQPCNQRNGGVGWTHTDALGATIGEALERYALAYCPYLHLILAAWKDLPKEERPPHPRRWPHFSSEQLETFRKRNIPFQSFTETTPVRWTLGWDLLHARSAWIPAQTVYIPYRMDEKETPIYNSISTGAAFHRTLERALITGLFENFERDAFSIWWHRKAQAPSIPKMDVLRIWPRAEEVFQKAERIWVKYITMDHRIPIVVVFALVSYFFPFINRRRRVLLMGASARMTLEEALSKAFLEIAQTGPFYRYLAVQDPEMLSSIMLPEQVHDFDQHAKYWIQHTEKHLAEISEWLSKGGEVRPTEILSLHPENDVEAVRALLKIAQDMKVSPLWVDLTTPDLKSLGWAVKVLIPELMPLEGAHIFAYLGVQRLWDVPEKAGLACEPDPNPMPHPSP